jgi:protein-disulfide isomerase/uncharacterized membrane protein
MGKRHCLAAAALAAIGAALAGALTYQHYYPAGGAALCGGSAAADCGAVGEWRYAAVLGVPLAAYGLFMYLFVLFTALVADHAGGRCRYAALPLIAAPVGLAVLADAALAAAMARLEAFCLLCVLTYAVNGALLATVVLWRRALGREGVSLREVFAALLPQADDGAEKKAAAALYAVFAVLLAFAVFATAQILEMKTAAYRQARNETRLTVEAFYRQGPENLTLPPSALTIGPADAKVKVAVFTDFLCSACAKFAALEKELRAKYGEGISFAYYSFPLDRECNDKVSRTVYESSCVASRAMLAAAAEGIFPQYEESHFAVYNALHGGYGRDRATEIAAGLGKGAGFAARLEAAAAAQTLRRDIALAAGLGVKATPTIFVNGRRLEGVPERAVIETIIERELR